MNAQVRAVRAAERQLRGFPVAVAAILRAESVAGRFNPALGWAEAAPFGTLGDVPGRAAERESRTPERGRSAATALEPGGTPSGGAADVGGGALAGVRRAVEGIGEAVARVAAGGGGAVTAGAAARATPGGIGAALGGGGMGGLGAALAGVAGGAGEGEARPVFSLGSIGRRAAAALSPEAAAGRRGGDSAGSGAGGALGAALAGEPVPDIGAATAAVGGGVGAAAVQAAGAAAAVVEALTPAMAAITRRLGVAAARTAEERSADPAGFQRPAAGASERSRLAAMAAAATRALGDTTPDELASSRAPTLEGQIEPNTAPASAVAPRSAGMAPQVIDAEWIVAVVGDALLEQARRQGVDLT